MMRNGYGPKRAAWLAALTGVTLAAGAAEGPLPASLFVRVAQSGEATPTNAAARAMDSAAGTFSLTTDTPGGFWTAELGRPYTLTRIELVNRPAPQDVEMGGLTLRLYQMDDQVVFQTNLTNPGAGATRVVTLPPGLSARSIWIGLPGSETNGAGNYRVGLAEVRTFGVLNMPFGPEPVAAITNGVQVWQSSEYGGFPAANAVDGSTGNFTHTADIPNSFWMADLGHAFSLDRIEIVNRLDCCANRLRHLVLRVYDAASNNISSATLTDVGLGGTYTHNLSPGTMARWMRVGLEGGLTNGGGNHYVTLAEVRAFSGATNVLSAVAGDPVGVTNNLASFKTSYMLRLDTSVPAATNANDDSYATETKTSPYTVDGYWETDLGATYALYGVRAIAASGISYRLTNTTVRLYNAEHKSVFAKKVAGAPDTFDTDLNGPVFARYVRVGLEEKQRTDPNDGIEWYIGFREVEVFGRPTNQVGILSFTASTNQVEAGQTVTLQWTVADVRRVELHPALGSVGAHTVSDGTGALTVTVSNSTEFILIASNAAGLFSREVSVQVSTNPPPVRLSEFVAENKFSLKDGDGAASDWIELRNTSDSPVNLAGWGLSDDPSQPMKWTFPATNLAPHSTLVVFTSGRETSFDAAGQLHASFRLSKSGGHVLLSSLFSNVVDTVSYPEQDTDLAYGRDLQGGWTFLEPTPGAVNAAVTYLGWLKAPDFSHARGFHETAFTLTLTNNSPGSTLLYSLDGSEPSLPYTAGLGISGTKAVRAQAVRPGYRPARSETKTFIFLNDVIASPLMNAAITQNPSYAPRLRPGLLALPSISICVPGQPEYAEKEGSIEILWPDGQESVQANCGIARFGNAWTKYPKRSINVKCRPRYGTSRLNAPLFNGFDRGVLAKTSFDEIDLRSGSQDMNERGFYMAGRFVHDSMLDMGSLNPHGRFVHVYLNGAYWGQYDAREVMVEQFLADYLGGPDEDYVAVKGNDNVGDDFALGAPEPPHILPWERAVSFRSSYNSIRPYVDVSHLIDFMLLWNYGNCESEYRSVGPMTAGSGFKFWIADADGFLQTSANGLNRTVRNGPGTLFSGLVGENNSDFKTLLADRIHQHFFNNGALTPARNDARLAARMQEIHDSLILECARWNYRTPANWESAAATIRSSLFPTRTSELFGMLRGAGLYPAFDPPSFNQYGGVVNSGFQPQLTSAAGTIYYTLDGSDPRLPGGGLAPGALIWVPGAVSITAETTINARVRNGSGQWSALARPQFVLATRRQPAPRDLLVTEIHYNPAGSDEFEFVELYNASSSPLDLSGVSLSNAVRFIFPNGTTLAPGACAVLVDNAGEFATRYQAPASPYYWPGLNVAGVWSGSLNNAGETLLLLASNGTVLASVDYKAGGDWPARADGSGSSMELRTLPPNGTPDAEVQAFEADGPNWTSSARYHGSPGRLETFVKSVRIHELLSHSLLGEDWLELRNTGTDPVSLTNCTLTDNLALPDRYVFSNAVLAPGQFLVLSATQLNFAFGEMGESAFLLEMSGTNIIRFLDTVDFPAAPPEEPFGLHQRVDGELDFTELTAVTPGAVNAAPRVGPVVISEIAFAPASGLAEFVELTSVTNVPVPLHDPLFPTNVWLLEGVGSFAFPTGTVLGPLEKMIVCATNPAAFRTQYGVSESVPVFGPWSGALDGNGETLKLLRPGPPQTNGVPLYRVDHVSYRTRAPWPPAAPGLSLQKTELAGYGNDSIHWTTAAPTPGTLLPPGFRPVILSQPESLSVNEGQTANFSLVATGTPPVVYQWRFNGAALSGATNTTLTLSNVQLAAAGAYDAIVFGPGGSVVSTSALLFVIKPPVISVHPTSQSARLTSNVVFSVTATGHGVLRYQWRRDGTPIPGATNSTHAIASAAPGDAGTYAVFISDDLGSILSAPATLDLLIDPLIVQQPLTQSVLAGGSVTLSVSVTNDATLPINYRWRRNGFTFTNFFLNSRTSFITLSNVQAPNTNWSVFITNVAKPAGLLSATAQLVILTDTNGNGLPDSWEAAHGFGVGNPAERDADVDDDGLTNWEEYIAGTNPTNAASTLRVEVPSAAGSATVRFHAMSNHTYSVYYTDVLDAGLWAKLADIIARSSNHVESVPDPGWTTNRFYRVVVPMQP